MKTQFEKYFSEHQLVSKSDRVLLAVSGGVDSMVMAQLFIDSELDFGIAHCNFGLRGEESDLDAELVEQFAEENDIAFNSNKFDVAKAKAKWKVGTQEAARRLRYEWFEKLCELFDYSKIATAHHRDDAVETFLFNLIRGGGYRAWSSMSPQNGKVIRPLLWASKEEIRAFSETEKVPFREDQTNFENNYSRNELRNLVIPELEKIKPGASKHIAEAIDHFAELKPAIENHLAGLTEKLVHTEGEKSYLDLKRWKDVREKSALLKHLSEGWGLEPVQIDQVKDLAESQSGKFVETNSGKIFREREHLVFVPNQNNEIESQQIERGQSSIDKPLKLEFSEEAVSNDFKSANSNQAFLDLDNLTFPLTLRLWQQGDKFQPLGMNGKQKVSDFLIQKKVPVFEKDRVMVIESAGEIAWIVGFRVAHPFRITENTERVFRVEIK
ncbi:tRNA lysidine(34) synthetase TilS [Halocola ammonii]